MNMIETQNLTKRYKDFTAVSHINLHIPRGQVYGFLGPNGAGKSTTMKMFLGLTKPTAGTFTIHQMSYPKDRQEILRKTGAFIESPSFYGNLTGEENLEILRRLLGLPKSSVRDALELTGLYEARRRLASKYSLGMKQRLGLAGALLGRPPLLILDEPFVGLDPKASFTLKQLMRELCERGHTIFFSTHVLEVAQKLCDRIAILMKGRIVAQGTMEEVIGQQSLEQVFLELADHE